MAERDDPVVTRMAAQLAEWEARGDGRAIFLDCYLQMTVAVHQRLGADGFADPAWVSTLLERFADYYFLSIDGGEEVCEIPAPWALAHAAAVGNDATVLQLLLAGVNAHINYDLVLTLIDVLDQEWHEADEAARSRRRDDYDAINTVIAATADLVQDRVVERRAPVLDVLDRALGRWDEQLAVRLLTGWRNRVWRDALRVLALDSPDARAARIATIEAQCARRGYWLLL